MQSLYMSSLSQDYTLDAEVKDQMEQAIECNNTSLNENIKIEANIFD